MGRPRIARYRLFRPWGFAPSGSCLHGRRRRRSHNPCRGPRPVPLHGPGHDRCRGLDTARRRAIYSPNHTRAFDALLGLYRAGGAWVPINARNAIAENAYILDHNEVEFLFYATVSSKAILKCFERSVRASLTMSASMRWGANASVLLKILFPVTKGPRRTSRQSR